MRTGGTSDVLWCKSGSTPILGARQVMQLPTSSLASCKAPCTAHPAHARPFLPGGQSSGPLSHFWTHGSALVTFRSCSCPCPPEGERWSPSCSTGRWHENSAGCKLVMRATRDAKQRCLTRRVGFAMGVSRRGEVSRFDRDGGGDSVIADAVAFSGGVIWAAVSLVATYGDSLSACRISSTSPPTR